LGIRHDQHLASVCETDERLHHMHVHHMQRPPTANQPPFLVLGDSAYADRLVQLRASFPHIYIELSVGVFILFTACISEKLQVV
jgi:hypothetical protein